MRRGVILALAIVLLAIPALGQKIIWVDPIQNKPYVLRLMPYTLEAVAYPGERIGWVVTLGYDGLGDVTVEIEVVSPMDLLPRPSPRAVTWEVTTDVDMAFPEDVTELDPSWVTVEPNRFTMYPGKRDIEVRVELPENIETGKTYIAALVARAYKEEYEVANAFSLISIRVPQLMEEEEDEEKEYTEEIDVSGEEPLILKVVWTGNRAGKIESFLESPTGEKYYPEKIYRTREIRIEGDDVYSIEEAQLVHEYFILHPEEGTWVLHVFTPGYGEMEIRIVEEED